MFKRHELRYHIEELISGNLLKLFTYDSSGYPVKLSTSGWHFLESTGGDAIEDDLIFVAMWFDHEMNEAWKHGLEAGIRGAGYRAHRVDQDPHTERIDMKLLADIRRSRLVVADATGSRPNVYYEAGYAEALGRPVVWTVRKDEKHKAQFDTRQFRHLVWTDPADLATQLEDYLGGLLGRRRPIRQS